VVQERTADGPALLDHLATFPQNAEVTETVAQINASRAARKLV
jgi:hypothetical protein